MNKETKQQLKDAVIKAIMKVGVENFKKTSLFMSNRNN